MADAVEKRRRSVYGSRFMLANLIVVAGFLGVLGLFAYLVSTGSADRGGRRTSRPEATCTTRRRRRPTTSRRTTSTTGSRSRSSRRSRSSTRTPRSTASPSPASRSGRSGARSSSSSRPNSTIAYVMCGGADKCGLSQVGSQETVPLLRREALELALYTFKYAPNVDSVVACLPPEGTTNGVIYLQRKNLTDELSKPLAATLPEHQVLSYGGMTRGRARAGDAAHRESPLQLPLRPWPERADAARAALGERVAP